MLVDFTRKLLNVLKHFEHRLKDPPEHAHLPPVVSKLMWLKGLKARIRVRGNGKTICGITTSN